MNLWRSLTKTFTVPRTIRIPLWISYVSTSSIILLILATYFALQPIIPIFYTYIEPAQQLAAKEWIGVFIVISLVISFVHTTIARLLIEKSLILAHLFAWATAFIQLLLLADVVRIIMIVW